MTGPEYIQVERPLLRQLVDMGWTHVEGARPEAFAPTDPAASERESFAEVLLRDRLRAAVRRINLDPDGRPWLDERRISQVVNELERRPETSLLAANEESTRILLDGVEVEGRPGWDGGRQQRVYLIDWDKFDSNDFVVVSQFRVDIPGPQGRRHIAADAVLFVNGIPLVVIECKRPDAPDAITQAIAQLHRYAERRKGAHREGNEKLFRTAQLTVATSGVDARLGTFTADTEHYRRWRDPYPVTRETLAAKLGKEPEDLTAQDILVEVVLEPARLLDIVRNFVTFMTTDSGKRVKIVPLYQQFRAVEKAIDRLLKGETKPIHGESDQRGGIIWHTQGSGKSLTMTFLVRKMRTIDQLKHVKVVVVTDRTHLQGQLSDTMRLTGEQVDAVKTVRETKRVLAEHGPGIVFVMIQKQQDIGKREAMREEGLLAEKAPSLGELNADESIVVLIDEAHRSHSSALHNNLLDALPNCARIGFTGTPIIMGKKRKSTEIFGPFLDVYKLAEAEADGTVVPIFYEGRTTKGAVRDGRELDDVFEDMFEELSDEERERLQRRYATKGEVLEAERLIADKARNMLHHYVGTVLPDGFKAQIVAHSREATVRYREALLRERDRLVRLAEELPEHLREVDPAELEPRRALLVRAYQQLDRLRAMDFVPVISAASNDEQRLAEWTDKAKQQARIDAFKRPFPDEIGENERPIAFLIVKSMLLTGFDAPIEQVLYIDRSLKEDDLLQAVARVNRTAPRKTCGYVVDYYGVANHLQEALQAYADEDVEGVLRDLGEEAAKLGPRSRRVRMLFTDRGVTPEPTEAAMERCVELLRDQRLFDAFDAELKKFLTTLNTVLPRPEAMPYRSDATLFAEIRLRARRRSRIDDGEFDPSLYGEKVRELIDQHMESLGIEEKLPPVSLTAPDFKEKVERLHGVRAQASEMEHAIRHHIEVNLGRDPRRYRLLSQRLAEILTRHEEDWERQVAALRDLVAEMEREDEPDGEDPLSPLERALYGVLLEETASDGVVDEDTDRKLCEFAGRLQSLAATETRRRDFWRRSVDQQNLVKTITQELFLSDICDLSVANSVASSLFEVLKRRRDEIPGP